MAISEHAATFAGRPVKLYEPGEPGPAGTVYRLALEYDTEGSFADRLDRFLGEHGGPGLTVLVVGAWNYEGMLDGANEVVEALASNAGRMPNLSALFFGDITAEECEMSWIQHGDVSALLPAFPKLTEFRIRGASNLTFGSIKHPALRSFAIESGGLPAALLDEVFAADLPALEHLELWLGTESYGGIANAKPLHPLLAGGLFPNLEYLGLRNCQIADGVAEALAASPLLGRIEVLDFSLGAFGDAGAAALLAAPALTAGRLKTLDLHHHYLSDAMVERLQALSFGVDVSDRQEADGDGDEEYRYVTVGE